MTLLEKKILLLNEFPVPQYFMSFVHIFSTYLFVLPGGEVHTHDRADAGGPPTCVNYRHAGGRENLPSTGKMMGKREKS